MARRTTSCWPCGRVYYLTGSKICAVYIIFILLRSVELKPSFTASPPDPFDVLEDDNITFVWQYNLNGTLRDVILRFVGSTDTLTIVHKHDLNLDALVLESDYQGRIQENITATRAEITIFKLPRSESGEYEIELVNKKLQRANDRVTVQVQCK